MEYKVIDNPPDVPAYLNIRKNCGLSPKTPATAQVGLAHTIFGVTVNHNDKPVGMGRIIGDRGCFLQIVDIAVLPEHQKKGLARKIMEALINYLKNNYDKTTMVSLFADVDWLYQKFGFEYTHSYMPGMVLKWEKIR